MKTVHEVSSVTGVSVRTLHHYDAIGLLKPTQVTAAGYRLYDDHAIARLHSILMFRQLDFSLKEIKRIIDSPDFDQRKALEQQITLLEMQKQQTERIIALAREMLDKGVDKMEFSVFDDSKLKEYAQEAKKRWGETDAYRESEEKRNSRTEKENKSADEGLMKVFCRFGENKTSKPDSPEAQALVSELQSYITENYYTCTKPILASLGLMYTADERFAKSIDAAGGDGTARFAAEAIAYFTAQ